MQKEFKVIGKVTYPQTINSHTTYTVMDTEGSNMILSLDSPSDSEFDYGDAVILTVTKKETPETTSIEITNISGSADIEPAAFENKAATDATTTSTETEAK